MAFEGEQKTQFLYFCFSRETKENQDLKGKTERRVKKAQKAKKALLDIPESQVSE